MVKEHDAKISNGTIIISAVVIESFGEKIPN